MMVNIPKLCKPFLGAFSEKPHLKKNFFEYLIIIFLNFLIRF